MKKLFLILLTFIFGINIQAANIAGNTLPSQKSILKTMEKVNEYFMKKYSDPTLDIVTNKVRPSNIWTRGVYYEGLMALYDIKPRKKYLKYATEWADFHQWNLRDGEITRNADNQCCGQTYIDLYKLQPDTRKIIHIKNSIDNMMHSEKVDDWWWIDALQMAMPIFADLAVIYNDDSYYDRLYEMYMDTKTKQGGGLYNAKDSLWWRDKDFVPPYREPNGEDCYWSRGNGWVIAALVRTMDRMTPDKKGYSEYKKTYLEMINALPRLQRSDGFWNASLHDPSNFGGKEVTGTSLFIYGMAWGVKKGWLSKEEFLPVITKAWNAIVNDAVHKNGFLGYVQGTGKEPSDGQPVTYNHVPDFEDYGIGCFLLAGSEVYQLARK